MHLQSFLYAFSFIPSIVDSAFLFLSSAGSPFPGGFSGGQLHPDGRQNLSQFRSADQHDSFSYSSSGSFLIHSVAPFRLKELRICRTSVTSQLLLQDVKLESPSHPFLLSCRSCGWSGFIKMNGFIHFILSAVFGSSPDSLRHHIELRRMLPDAAPASSDVLSFSELVSEVHSTSFRYEADEVTRPASGLLQLPEGRFAMQIFNESAEELVLLLLNPTAVLSAKSAEKVFLGNFHISGLAGLSYRNGLLCWTALTTGHCAFYQNNSLQDISTIISYDEARAAEVCRGPVNPMPIGRILTGLAIAATGNPLSVYFGCFANSDDYGGVGHLQLEWTGIGVKRKIESLKSGENGEERVRAGQLVVVDELVDSCNPATTTPGTPEKTATATAVVTAEVTVGLTAEVTVRVTDDSNTNGTSTAASTNSCAANNSATAIATITACIVLSFSSQKLN